MHAYLISHHMHMTQEWYNLYSSKNHIITSHLSINYNCVNLWSVE